MQNYLRKKYGDDHVAHISNVNTITPKVYVRDIARACELGGSKESAVQIGNMVADCIPADIKSIDDAILKLPLFMEYAKKYPEFIKYKDISGLYRAYSTHAGGIIISARPLTGLVPLRRDKDGALSIEYDKNATEENGLIKMDTLGLSTLDILTKTCEIIKERGKEVPDLNFDYDVYDEKTYDLISKGDTYGIFQFGTSGGTIDLCKRIKPKTITDLANINALARPSAREMRNDFIATRDGKKKMTLLHPNLSRAFDSTYGFGLYEECLLYIAQDIAGWNLHSADRLRKLTKEKGKNPKKVKEWRQEFIDDSVKNNINEEIAKRIWDEVIDLFQGYGFNVSHAVLYSMIGYQTAYLKAHFPVEFLLANLMAEVKSLSPDSKSNIEKIKKELRAHNVKISPPDINTSKLSYSISEDNKLLTGLDALKFVSDEAINDIIAKRPFKDFADFMARVDSKTVRSNSIQALAAAGALDSFKLSRRAIFQYVSDYRKKLQVWLKKHDPLTETFSYPWVNEKDWTLSELYALESHYLGESFICKPALAYGTFFKDATTSIAEIKKYKEKSSVPSIKLIVRDFFEFRVKKEGSKYFGMPMIKATVEDRSGEQCKLTIFPDKWGTVEERIKMVNSKFKFENGLALHISASTNNYEDDMGLILENLFNVSGIPALPADVKEKKKVNLKEAKKTNTSKQLDLFSEIEDSLYDQRLD